MDCEPENRSDSAIVPDYRSPVIILNKKEIDQWKNK